MGTLKMRIQSMIDEQGDHGIGMPSAGVQFADINL
jgi:hypothetical protein